MAVTRFDVDVDSGCIMALIVEKKTPKSIPIKKGKYKLTLSVDECWKGKIKNYDFLDVKKDSFLAIDDGFLDEDGKYVVDVDDLHKKGCALNTGGDGTFNLKVSIVPVKEITHNPQKIRMTDAKRFIKDHEMNEKNIEKYCKKFLEGGAYSFKLVNLVDDVRLKQIRLALDQCKKYLDEK